MFDALHILDIRQPYYVDYQVPTLDALNDQSGGVLILPPDAPVLVGVANIGVEWETVSTATGYYVEQLSSGTIWSRIATVAQPAPLRLIWNITEWDLDVQVSGVWTTLYRSTDDVASPDLVTTWLTSSGASPVPVVTSGGPVGAGGVSATSAGDSRANSAFLLSGTQNGKNFYSSPEVASFIFTPSPTVLYRVRGYNTAGSGVPSNAMVLNGS